MKPPHPPRSAGDLPKRVPGTTRQVSPGSGPTQDGTAADDTEPAAPKSGDRTPGAAGRGTSMPRLSRIASLGARGSTGRGGPAAGTPVDGPAGDRPVDNFARRGESDKGSVQDLVVPLTPADRKKGDKSRREGSRGALGVVGVVGLLAAGSVVLTLGLINGDSDEKGKGSSVSVDSRGHGTDVIDGLGDVSAPSAEASGADASKKPDASEKPSTSASPTSGASGKASASPGKQTTAPAEDRAETKSTAQAAAPGVSVFSHASNRCIDIVGGKAVQGARLMIWDCNQSASQHWTFTGGTMRGLGMCVQLGGGSTDDGTDLELASCNGSATQQFELNVRHDLVNSLADKCTDVRDNGTANGTRLQLWSCSGSPNQKWSES